MCVEEVAADGTVGATLLAWNKYGTCSGNIVKPSDYIPATIAVETTATRFKVSVRHTGGYNKPYPNAGVAIFALRASPRRNLLLRAPKLS